MKSERRHELQTNVLADWTGHQIDSIRPHLTLIATVFLAAVAAVLGWMYFRARTASQTTAAWTDFYQASDASEPAALLEMANRHAGEPASVWALLLAADVQLAQGAEQAFTNRKESEKLLTQAAKSYETVLRDLTEPVLRRRALYGVAESHESLFAVTGDKDHLDSALKHYQQITNNKEWTETTLGKAAAQKYADLKAKSTQDFLAWFSQQEPVQQETPGTGAESAAPSSPFDLSTLPGADELMLPEEEPAPSTPETTTPDGATPEATPSATTPEAATTPESPASPASGDAAQPREEGAPAEGENATEPAPPAAETPAKEGDAEPASEAPASEEAPAEGEAPAESETSPETETPPQP
jgi:hypothetical protein